MINLCNMVWHLDLAATKQEAVPRDLHASAIVWRTQRSNNGAKCSQCRLLRGFKMFATFEEMIISNRSYQSLVSTVGAREANGSSRSKGCS